MNLLQRIIECKDEEIDLIIKERIEICNNNTPVERLGFIGANKLNNAFRGFIPLKTRIKYGNISIEDYGMETTDFIYEFAHFLKKYNINNKISLVYSLEHYINSYFGLPGKIDRETIFNVNAWQTTTTDEEYFKALKNNKLENLKGTGAAQCTERAALAQQVLSVFDSDVYYCMGCVNARNKEEAHCFNIIKRRNDYALLDYSMPIVSYDINGNVKEYYPFVGIMSNEEFKEFINNANIKSFDDYYMNDHEVKKTSNKRKYVVGRYEMEKSITL